MGDYDSRPPSQGFRDGPVMPHGTVTTNCVVDFETLQIRFRASQRRGGPRIAPTTQPTNHAVLSIEHGDLLFRQNGSQARMINVPKSVPRCLVFAAFNLMTEEEANDAVLIGVARNHVRPNQGQNLDNPVLAAVVHGMISTINNGPHVFEAGDIVIALPPDADEAGRQLGDPARGLAPEKRATTGIPGHRAVAVTVPMHSSYSIYFEKSINSLPRAYASFFEDTVPQATRDALTGFTDRDHQYSAVTAGGKQSIGGATAAAMHLETDGHRQTRPFTCLQPYLYAEMQQVSHDLISKAHVALTALLVDGHAISARDIAENQVETGKIVFDLLLDRLVRLPVFMRYATFAFGTNVPDDVGRELRQLVAAFPAPVKAVSLVTRLIVDHVDFMRMFYRTKTLGKAMAQAPRNSTLHVYVNPNV